MSALDRFPAAALAAASLPSTGSGRATPPRRPDPDEQLLAAVRGRDRQLGSRLLQQWVHRRGLASLELFRLRLAAAEGASACEWLEQLIDRPMAAVPATAEPLSLLPQAAPVPAPSDVAQPPAPAVVAGAAAAASAASGAAEASEQASAPEVEPPPLAAPAAGLPAAAADRVTAELDQALSSYWQASDPLPPADRLAIAATNGPVPPASIPESAAPSSPPEEAAAGSADAADSAASGAAQDTGGSDPGESIGPGAARGLAGRVLAAGRHSFTGLRSLVRDCLDEALGGFSGPDAAARTRPPVGASDAGSDSSGLSALPLELPVASPAAAAGAEPQAAVEVPAGRPAAPLAAAGRGEPASLAVPAPRPWQSSPAAPRRSPAPRGDRPAPTPADLSDLRSWLPDSADTGRPAF